MGSLNEPFLGFEEFILLPIVDPEEETLELTPDHKFEMRVEFNSDKVFLCV
jgi:hypothetical protein